MERREVVRRAELRRRREAGTGVVMGLPGRRERGVVWLGCRAKIFR